VLLKPELAESLKDWDPGLSQWRWLRGGPAAHRMLRLLQTYRRRHALRNEELEECVYEVLASLPGGKSSGRTARPPRWLELIRQELDDTFADGPRVRDLAARAGIHPVYLARRFRRHIGCSITDYRTLLRARAAAELLASSGVPLAAAADQCGFADQSHLCRVFKAATGLTPLDYRRLAKGS
jgi:AraC family transcriptional regulator